MSSFVVTNPPQEQPLRDTDLICCFVKPRHFDDPRLSVLETAANSAPEAAAQGRQAGHGTGSRPVAKCGHSARKLPSELLQAERRKPSVIGSFKARMSPADSKRSESVGLSARPPRPTAV